VGNAYSGELLSAHVALSQGQIANVGEAEIVMGPETEVVDASGFYLTAGWIEPHSHPWILYHPVSLLEGILPDGTTQIFHQNLFFYLQGGPEGFQRVLEVEPCRPCPFPFLTLQRLVPATFVLTVNKLMPAVM